MSCLNSQLIVIKLEILWPHLKTASSFAMNFIDLEQNVVLLKAGFCVVPPPPRFWYSHSSSPPVPRVLSRDLPWPLGYSGYSLSCSGWTWGGVAVERPRPMRREYSGHVISIDQWEASITWRRGGAVPGVVDGVTLELLELLTKPRDPVNAVNILKTNNQNHLAALTIHNSFFWQFAFDLICKWSRNVRGDSSYHQDCVLCPREPGIVRGSPNYPNYSWFYQPIKASLESPLLSLD